MKRNRQARSIPLQFKTRSEEDGEKYISGYFAVFNSNYEMWEAAISKAWDLGVRRFVTEFWYTGNENWKADLNSAAGMAKPILEKMN